MTDFTPKFSIEDGLSRTVQWFMNDKNLSKYKPEIYNV